jgi:hypothetical protein
MRPTALVLVTLLFGPLAAADHDEWQELALRPTDSPSTDVVEFRGKGGRLSWIRVSPMRGIHRIDIVYVNRPPQSFWGHRYDRLQDQVIEVDRNARIRRIVVACKPSRCGTYRVFGS